LVAAAAIIGPLLLLIWLDLKHNFRHPAIWLGPLAILISQLACQETVSLMRAKQLPVTSITCHLSTFAIGCLSLLPVVWPSYSPACPLGKPGWTLLGFAAAFCIVAIDEMLRYQEPGVATSRMAHNLFVASYAGVLAAFLIQLRMLEPSDRGMLALVGTIITVKFSDTGAYFIGRSFGRRKLSSILSPKKTIEGAIGGIVAACLGAALTFWAIGPYVFGVVLPNVSWLETLGFGISLAVAGMIGDLFESLLKRDAETKDSSVWLPGLGGVLDVVDSILAVAPVSFAWWISGLLS
jgi:phosphatidate cytidylyltransferase